jgi:hypothetical protein
MVFSDSELQQVFILGYRSDPSGQAKRRRGLTAELCTRSYSSRRSATRASPSDLAVCCSTPQLKADFLASCSGAGARCFRINFRCWFWPLSDFDSRSTAGRIAWDSIISRGAWISHIGTALSPSQSAVFNVCFCFSMPGTPLHHRVSRKLQ